MVADGEMNFQGDERTRKMLGNEDHVLHPPESVFAAEESAKSTRQKGSKRFDAEAKDKKNAAYRDRTCDLLRESGVKELR